MDRVCSCEGPHKAMCPVLIEGIDAQAAAAAIYAGEKVRMALDGAVSITWLDGDKVMMEAIEGWAAGVVEPVCFAGSAYLTEHHLRGTLDVLPEGMSNWAAIEGVT